MEEVKNLLRSLGVEIHDVGISGGGHVVFECEKAGVKRKIFTSWSPSDRRSYLNIRRSVRKVFK
jgi:hypothetical protein